MEKKPTDAKDQIIANQVSGMPLEEAVFHAGYSAGYNNGYERGKREAGHGAVWVKGSPKDREQHIARVSSYIDDENVYDAIIWPIDGTEHWWAIGNGFKFTIHNDKIIEWLDESGVDAWISVDEQLPEIGEYVMVYNTERARLIGRLMSNGWVAFFWDGEQLMGELTATHWRELPAGPKGR